MNSILNAAPRSANATDHGLLPSVAPEDAAIARTIREEASDQGISRAKLAKKARVSEKKIEACWEDAGQYTLPEIARIAAALDVAPSYLYGVRQATEPVHMPTSGELGVTVIKTALLGRDKPQPGDLVQVTTTQDPRRDNAISYHLSKEMREEGSSWVSDCNVTATVGSVFTFLGTLKQDRVTYALLGELAINDGNRGN